MSGELNRHPDPRSHSELSGHGQVADALVSVSVANIVADPAIEHPLTEGLIERNG